MFTLFKKRVTVQAKQLLNQCTDVHAHLLPGVDDGVPSIEEARYTIEYLEQLGVQNMFLTPHIMVDFSKNRTPYLRECFAEFKKLCPSTIQFRLAAEYMLDFDYLEKLDEGALTFDGTHILVETSYMAAPPNFESLIYETQLRGYTPILAHPERYLYQSYTEICRLRRNGVKLQLNLLSLTGAYGRRVKELALELLSDDLYDFVGTDLHRSSSFDKAINELKISERHAEALKVLYENNFSLFNT